MNGTAFTLAAIKKAEGPIPELRPPKGKIPFDVPESAIFMGLVVFAFTVLFIGRIRQLLRPPPPPPLPQPIVRARTALAAVTGADALQQCGWILRRYLHEAFGLGPEGATASELHAQFLQHGAADAHTADALDAFLNDVDLARFTPLGADLSAETCVARTMDLLQALELRRKAAQYTPLPVVS